MAMLVIFFFTKPDIYLFIFIMFGVVNFLSFSAGYIPFPKVPMIPHFSFCNFNSWAM